MMKIKTLLFFVCCISPLMAAQNVQELRKYSAPEDDPTINVLIAKDVSSAILEVKGPFKVVSREVSAYLSAGTVGKRYAVHALMDGLRWGEEFPDIYQFTVIPQSNQACCFVDGIQYKGCMTVYHTKNNRVSIVNEVPVEDFLKSSLVLKYDTQLPKEAKSALAIVERTGAYARILHPNRARKPWDITAEDACYQGYGVTLNKNGVDEIVDRTRFLVIEDLGTRGPALNPTLSPSQAEELAKRGCDAKKILSSTFPDGKIGVASNLR